MMLFRLFLIYYFTTTVGVCRDEMLELLNSKNIADFTQRAIELGAQTIRNNYQTNKKFPRPTPRIQERSETSSDFPRELGKNLFKILSSFGRPTTERASSVGTVSNSLTPKQPERSDSSGCPPFVNGFMKIAHENCIQLTEQRTADAWNREVTSFVTGKGMDLPKVSKETCKRMVEKKQCGQLRTAISNCDVFNSVQITMNMQKEIEQCGELINESPTSLIGGVSGLINGESTKDLLHNFLG
ncbi:hypothetical protein FO519_002815 [Halicephalobus sp. NKZ332]|nr:hypothetical protein FO519_002815 [Halicephalobus sp. NKZ332]